MKLDMTKSVAGQGGRYARLGLYCRHFCCLAGARFTARHRRRSRAWWLATMRTDRRIFKVTVVEHTTRAINYQHRSGSTEVDFRGTELMPEARGEANVNSKQGRIEIKVRVDKMSAATQYGPEYLTYVLWAVTPEGRPKNLGEVLLNGGDHSSMEVTTDLQTFGLIMTAEPYFAVTQPSNVVVMENVVSDKTVGTIEPINVHYELLERGQYVLNVDRVADHAVHTG